VLLVVSRTLARRSLLLTSSGKQDLGSFLTPAAAAEHQKNPGVLPSVSGTHPRRSTQPLSARTLRSLCSTLLLFRCTRRGALLRSARRAVGIKNPDTALAARDRTHPGSRNSQSLALALLPRSLPLSRLNDGRGLLSATCAAHLPLYVITAALANPPASAD
jgi:hypothetical protein